MVIKFTVIVPYSRNFSSLQQSLHLKFKYLKQINCQPSCHFQISAGISPFNFRHRKVLFHGVRRDQLHCLPFQRYRHLQSNHQRKAESRANARASASGTSLFRNRRIYGSRCYIRPKAQIFLYARKSSGRLLLFRICEQRRPKTADCLDAFWAYLCPESLSVFRWAAFKGQILDDYYSWPGFGGFF